MREWGKRLQTASSHLFGRGISHTSVLAVSVELEIVVLMHPYTIHSMLPENLEADIMQLAYHFRLLPYLCNTWSDVGLTKCGAEGVVSVVLSWWLAGKDISHIDGNRKCSNTC